MSSNSDLMDIAVNAAVSPSLEWPDSISADAFGYAEIDDKDNAVPYPGKQPVPAIRYIEDETSDEEKTERELLVVSPYTSKSHLLDLSSVEPSSQYLARALTIMRPVRADYATAPYHRSFNWPAVVDYLRGVIAAEKYGEWEEERFYVIVFRSQIPRTTDRSTLGKLDELAHQEAMESGGLLKYWFGTPDKTGRNLATCVWRRRDDARLGGAGPGHAKAMQATKALYTEWKVQRLSLNIGRDAESWSFTEWRD